MDTESTPNAQVHVCNLLSLKAFSGKQEMLLADSIAALNTPELCAELYTALLKEAWEVQNAVNLAALVNRWWGVQQNIRHIATVCQGLQAGVNEPANAVNCGTDYATWRGETTGNNYPLIVAGTEWLNKNWVNNLWLCKLADLNGLAISVDYNQDFSAWDAGGHVVQKGKVVSFRPVPPPIEPYENTNRI